MKKRVVVALGHRALGTTLPEQKEAVKKTAKVIGDLIEKGYQVAVTHSNAPQVGMIHTAMNEFAKEHEDYTAAPMSVCSARYRIRENCSGVRSSSRLAFANSRCRFPHTT